MNLITKISNLFKLLCKSNKANKEACHSEEEKILHNLETFAELQVEEVMIPRTEILGIPMSSSHSETKKAFIEMQHTRLPVYTKDLDDIKGFIHIKDFISNTEKSTKNFKIKDIMRDLIYIPFSMKVVDLLSKMKASKVHMAIVIDEYGGTEGLVTIEDLIEEVIGEIKDEHDDDKDFHFKEVSANCFEVDARIEIDDLVVQIPIDIDSSANSYDTLSGFILSELGHVPTVGEKFTYDDTWEICVISGDNRRVNSVTIKKLSDERCLHEQQ